MSIHRDLEHAVELATRVLNAVESGLIGRITDCQHGHPSAARWDLERSSGTPWCWTCERDLRECHANDFDCQADDVLSGPSDPTGEAAMRPDGAAIDLENFRNATKRLMRAVDLMANIADDYPATRAASDYEKELTAGNEPQCESCARFRDDRNKPYWSTPMLNGSDQPYRTTRGDVLTEPMYLCRACDTHVAMRGVLPNEQELRQVHEHGKQLMRICRHPEKAEEAA